MTRDPSIETRQRYVRAPKVAFAWKAGGGPSATIDDYDYVVVVTGIGGDRPAWGSGIRPVPTDTALEGRQCTDTDAFVEVEVECVKGKCDMPPRMYLGAKSGSTCYGKAFGLVAPPNPTFPQCDWQVDTQSYAAVYIGRPGHASAGKTKTVGNPGSTSTPATSAMFYWGLDPGQ